MASPKTGVRVRQSVALPLDLVEEVRSLAAPELRKNLNGIVTVALREFVARRRREEFEVAMAEMARDPTSPGNPSRSRRGSFNRGRWTFPS